MPRAIQNDPVSDSRSQRFLQSAIQRGSAIIDGTRKAGHNVKSGIYGTVLEYRAGAEVPLWIYLKAFSEGQDSASVPKRFMVPPIERLNRLESIEDIIRRTRPEILGDYSCIYGTQGLEVSAEVSYDVGSLSFLTTGFLGLNLSLKVTLGAAAGKKNHILLMTHQAFKRSMGFPKPLSLLSLTGREYTGAVSGAVSGSVGLGPNISIGGIPLQIELAGMGGRIEAVARTIVLEDGTPGHYLSPLDSDLSTKLYAAANPGRQYVKKLTDDWRAHLKNNVWGTAILNKYPFLKDLLDENLALSISGRAGSNNVLNWLEKLKGIGNLPSDKNGEPTKIPVQQNAENLYKTLEWAAEEDEMKSGSKQAETSASAQKSYFKIFSFSTNADLSATIGPVISAEINGGPFSASIGTKAQAVSSAIGNFQFVSYRYKTTNFSQTGQIGVYTQDTKITYSNVTAEVSAGVQVSAGASVRGANLVTKEAGRSMGRTYQYRNMLYHSANIYRNSDVSCPGSGLAIGLSIDLNIIHSIRQADVKTAYTILQERPFHNYLAINEDLLIGFLKDIPGESLKYIQEKLSNKALLIESGFILNQSYKLFRNEKKEIANLVDYFFYNAAYAEGRKKFYRPKQDICSLGVLRCRLPLGNLSNHSGGAFKLGFSVGAGVELGFERTSRAGDAYVSDIFCKFFSQQANFHPTVLIPHTLDIF